MLVLAPDGTWAIEIASPPPPGIGTGAVRRDTHGAGGPGRHRSVSVSAPCGITVHVRISQFATSPGFALAFAIPNMRSRCRQ